MGFKTKVQVIQRKSGYQQWYIGFPAACAHMLDFKKGEPAEWGIDNNGNLVLKIERRLKQSNRK